MINFNTLEITMRLLSAVITIAAVSACGSLKNEDKATAPAATDDSAAIAHSSTLSPVTIIRVPVGADGKEANDKAEMRLSDDKEISKESVEASFASAKAPDSVIDELDASTSTESYHGYVSCGRGYGNSYGNGYGNGNGNRYGNSYGNGNGNSYGNGYGNGNGNSYGNGYGNNYWTFYRPTYYNGGFNYQWNYANNYNNGGYNYYQYNSAYGNGYSGRGQVSPYAQNGSQYPTNSGYGQTGSQYPTNSGYGQTGSQYPANSGYGQTGSQYPANSGPTQPTAPTNAGNTYGARY
jgi:hypothetical protein